MGDKASRGNLHNTHAHRDSKVFPHNALKRSVVRICFGKSSEICHRKKNTHTHTHEPPPHTHTHTHTRTVRLCFRCLRLLCHAHPHNGTIRCGVWQRYGGGEFFSCSIFFLQFFTTAAKGWDGTAYHGRRFFAPRLQF